jgi:hypothetical protein
LTDDERIVAIRKFAETTGMALIGACKRKDVLYIEGQKLMALNIEESFDLLHKILK